MKSSEKKSNLIFIIIIVLIVLGMGAGIFASLNMFFQSEKDNEALHFQLAQSDMEAAIMTLQMKTEREMELKKEADEARQAEERRALKDSFLKNEKVSLLELVNPWNYIREDYEPRLTDIGDGMLFDMRAAQALKEMLEGCSERGGFPSPISTYRTQEYQQELFDNKVKRVIAQGYSADVAPDKAATQVARPGTSEHQLGLAVDIVDEYYPELDYSQEWTGTQRWLMQHCSEYGFILRYPTQSSEITGIIYEPWHYRYVGKTIAREITERGITLEEYLEELP